MATKRKNYSFLPGCGKVSKEDYPKLQEELRTLLGCKTRQHFYKKRKHFPDMPFHVMHDIESIFEKYGVAAEDVWEITDMDGDNSELNQ